MHKAITSTSLTSYSVIQFGVFVILVAIFSREIGKGVLLGIDFDFIAYSLYLLLAILLLVKNRITIHRKLLLILIIILFGGIFIKNELNLSLLPLIKQWLPISLIYILTAAILQRSNLERIFARYISFALIAAWIGILQIVLKLFQINFLTPYSAFRIDSIAEEPSHFAVIIMPALVYCFINRLQHPKKFFLFFVVLILTFNLTAYTTFAFVLLIFYRRLQYFVLIVPLLYYLGVYLYEVNPEFQVRIDGFISFLSEGSYYDLHGTPLSFLSNGAVALESFTTTPLFGCGLGGHEEMYDRYFMGQEFSRFEYLYGLNAKSAHSLSIRIISELGLFGIAIYTYILSLVFRVSRRSVYYPIALACFSHFIAKTLKLGNYFDLGTPFFLLMIYFVHLAYRQNQRSF